MERTSNLKRIEIQEKELENLNDSYEGNLKARRKRELILTTTCLIALIYSYPVKDFQSNPEIEIPAISLRILLKDAISVFPTIISSIYLIYFSSVITQLVVSVRRIQIKRNIENYLETGELLKSSELHRRFNFGMSLREVMLPSPLHIRTYMYNSTVHEISKAVVDVFVGIVFNLLPYVTMIFITVKSYQLSHNEYIFRGISYVLL